MCTCMCVGENVYKCMKVYVCKYGDQKTTFRSQFSLSVSSGEEAQLLRLQIYSPSEPSLWLDSYFGLIGLYYIFYFLMNCPCLNFSFLFLFHSHLLLIIAFLFHNFMYVYSHHPELSYLPFILDISFSLHIPFPHHPLSCFFCTLWLLTGTFYLAMGFGFNHQSLISLSFGTELKAMAIYFLESISYLLFSRER